VTGGELAAPMQRKATAAIVNVLTRVIAPVVYHFVIAVWRAKDAESRCVKHWQPTLIMFASLCVSLALADDGKEYKDATVSRVEPDGIVLRTKFGISKVYFVELPKEVQERFHLLTRYESGGWEAGRASSQ
jgi:hypothetical protein